MEKVHCSTLSDQAPANSIQSSNLNNQDAQVDWNIVQPFILSTDADCLILLDCCYAAKGAKDSGTILKGTNEIIAACGPESTTTGVERRSFTSVLVRQLEEFAHAFRKEGKNFTAVGLHSALFRFNRELQYGPFYVRLTNAEYSSIDLTPLPNTKISRDNDSDVCMDLSTEAILSSESSSLSNTPETVVKVLVAIHLSRSPRGDLVRFLRGEGLIPDYVNGMEVLTVEAVFESNSTLVILSMPISVWDLLPEDTPCSYVGTTYSKNLLISSETRQLPSATTRDVLLSKGDQALSQKDRSLSIERGSVSSINPLSKYQVDPQLPPAEPDIFTSLLSANRAHDLSRPARYDVSESDGGSDKTALHHAAQNGRVEVLNSLLDKGADVLAVDSNGKTALHYAAQNGHVKVLNSLLDNGADIHAVDSNGKTALHYAAQDGHVKVLNSLLDKGADIHAVDSNRKSALHHAAQNGYVEVLNSLLDKGADVLAVDSNGKTALHYAAQDGRVQVLNSLLEKGADIHAVDSNRKTALHYAAQDGHVEVLNSLLDKGAEILAVDNNGQTPLHYAFKSSNNKHIKTLLYQLEKKGDGCLERALAMLDNKDRTPRDYANSKDPEWIDQLIYIGRYHGNE
jgi:ankyrin repeat protein